MRLPALAFLSIMIAPPAFADDAAAPVDGGAGAAAARPIGALARLQGRSKSVEEPRVRLFWSAAELADADLEPLWPLPRRAFVDAVGGCRVKRRAAGKQLDLREVRIEHLDASHTVIRELRCVLPLAVWRAKLGGELVDLLERKRPTSGEAPR